MSRGCFYSALLLIAFTVVTVSCSRSAPDSADISSQKPAAPSGLAVISAAPNRVVFHWADNSGNENGFRVYAREGTESPWQFRLTLAADSREAGVDGLTAHTLYTFRVTAFNEHGESEPSREIAVETQIAPPSAPAALTVDDSTKTRLLLSFRDTAGNEDGFRLYARSSLEDPWTLRLTLPADAHEAVADNLVPNTAYVLRITAFNGGGESAPSGEVHARTLPDPPAPPDFLQVTGSTIRTVTLSWHDNSANEDSFFVYQHRSLAEPWAFCAFTGRNETHVEVAGLHPATHYIFHVTAWRATGESIPSNETSAETYPPSLTGGHWYSQPPSSRQVWNAYSLSYTFSTDSTFDWQLYIGSQIFYRGGSYRVTSDSIYFTEAQRDGRPVDSSYVVHYHLSELTDSLFIDYRFSQTRQVVYRWADDGGD